VIANLSWTTSPAAHDADLSNWYYVCEKNPALQAELSLKWSTRSILTFVSLAWLGCRRLIQSTQVNSTPYRWSDKPAQSFRLTIRFLIYNPFTTLLSSSYLMQTIFLHYRKSLYSINDRHEVIHANPKLD
jgi:hypothetical protein